MAASVRYMFCGHANSVKMIVITLEFKPKYEDSMRLPELTVAFNIGTCSLDILLHLPEEDFLSLTLLLLVFQEMKVKGYTCVSQTHNTHV
jgi:hypothetical protein